MVRLLQVVRWWEAGCKTRVVKARVEGQSFEFGGSYFLGYFLRFTIFTIRNGTTWLDRMFESVCFVCFEAVSCVKSWFVIGCQSVSCFLLCVWPQVLLRFGGFGMLELYLFKYDILLWYLMYVVGLISRCREFKFSLVDLLISCPYNFSTLLVYQYILL